MVTKQNLRIVEIITARCKERNIRLRQLLLSTNSSPRLVSDWYKGKTYPSFQALEKICALLDLDMLDFFEPVFTEQQQKILDEWKTLSKREKQALYCYIRAMKSNH